MSKRSGASKKKNKQKSRQQKQHEEDYTPPYYPRPTDIEKFIRKLNAEGKLGQAAKTFLIYIWERRAYGFDWADDYVFFCLSSYFILKNKYPILSGLYDMPPLFLILEETLTNIKFMPGITCIILELLKIKIEHCNPDSKICHLIIDESQLSPNIFFWDKYDDNIGFEDDGKCKGSLPACFVTHIWIQGVNVKWAIPFAYYFTHKSCPADTLREYLLEAISKLDAIGLDVIGVIIKVKVNFLKLADTFNISVENQSFRVGNKNIVLLFDVQQLMIITRNNLMKYKFKFELMQTSWDYVNEVFFIECESEGKNKLSNNHLSPSENEMYFITYAVETLSNEVAAEMKFYISSGQMSESAIGTAECIELFATLYSIMNSSEHDSEDGYARAYNGSDVQVGFLEKMIDFFEELKIHDRSEQDITDNVIFIKAWIISIKGVMELWEVVQRRNYPYLLTNTATCDLFDTFEGVTPHRHPTHDSNTDVTGCYFLELFGLSFTQAYFKKWTIDDSDDGTYELETYANKVYNRIPQISHDITGATQVENDFWPMMEDHTRHFHNFMKKWYERNSGETLPDD